jgi:glycosyltransferase involved in cell wall biosynthesis
VVLGHGSVSGVDAEGTFSIPANWQEVRRELRSRYGIPHGATVLGFVGRLAREKGLGELTEAWRRLRSSYQNLHLLLVGGLDARDPPTACDLDFLSSEERSHLVGFQTNTPAHYLAMDVCVTPSYREGFGLTNIEASAMCLPVVSTRIPGCTDSVLDGVTGTLVPVHDVAALTRAIENYLVNPDLAQRHGRAGRERVLKDFRPEALWEALQAEYLGLLGKRGLQPLPSDGG